jgi:hypothetical protein
VDFFQSAYELAARTAMCHVAVPSGDVLENYLRDNLLNTAVASANCEAPIVGPALLTNRNHLTFGAFLNLPETHRCFDSGDLHTLLRDLIQAREFHYYFGLEIDRFRKHKTRSRKQLTRYVRRAYRGSTRGVRYWSRLAKILWLAYERLEQMRYWANRTRVCEIERLERQAHRAREARTRCARRRARLAKLAAAKSKTTIHNRTKQRGKS